MRSDSRPIGIFDSGIGGFTVLKQLRKRLPQESFVYVAGNVFQPFGDKKPKEILEINDRIITCLLREEVKLVVIACNTSSSIALEHNKINYPVPFVDMLLDGLWFTQGLPAYSKIGVIATQATVDSQSYIRTISNFRKQMIVHQQACPKLVPLIEQMMFSADLKTQELHQNASLVEVLTSYLAAVADCEYVVMGCSHYPYLASEISRILPSAKVIDPAIFVAERAKEYVEIIGKNKRKAVQTFYYTQEDPALIRNATRFVFDTYQLVSV